MSRPGSLRHAAASGTPAKGKCAGRHALSAVDHGTNADTQRLALQLAAVKRRRAQQSHSRS
eukprot:6580244-Prorocentrum_lima.AAC.1